MFNGPTVRVFERLPDSAVPTEYDNAYFCAFEGTERELHSWAGENGIVDIFKEERFLIQRNL